MCIFKQYVLIQMNDQYWLFLKEGRAGALETSLFALYIGKGRVNVKEVSAGQRRLWENLQR